MTERPRSPTSTFTGLAGIFAGAAAIVVLHSIGLPGYIRTLLVLGTAAIAMIVVDLVFYRSRWNESSGLAPSVINPLNLARIGKKLVGFWGTIAIILAVYAVLPEYAGSFYDPVREAFLLILPYLAVLSPLYVWYVDQRQRQPDDIYVEVFNLFAGRRPDDWSALANYARSWLVKAFFLPLMFVFSHNYLAGIWLKPLIPALDGFGAFYDLAYMLIFLGDVMIATVGYSLTLRVFDGHIRSAEPTVFGWVVCLACYPPFWNAIGSAYLSYDQDGMYWGHFFGGIPALYVVWGLLILSLLTVYTWATAAFGIRFSNLTHRGIITNGPYRWVKHPAYISKNLSWWLISLPFVTATGDWLLAVQSSALLLGVNLIYFLRAVTEERHLSRDPAYRDYQAFIAEHGLWAIVKRRFGWRPAGTDAPTGSPMPPGDPVTK
jgi:protein-S-isoprenylcysteine O-methyltransferase Ste14